MKLRKQAKKEDKRKTRPGCPKCGEPTCLLYVGEPYRYRSIGLRYCPKCEKVFKPALSEVKVESLKSN